MDTDAEEASNAMGKMTIDAGGEASNSNSEAMGIYSEGEEATNREETTDAGAKTTSTTKKAKALAAIAAAALAVNSQGTRYAIVRWFRLVDAETFLSLYSRRSRKNQVPCYPFLVAGHPARVYEVRGHPKPPLVYAGRSRVLFFKGDPEFVHEKVLRELVWCILGTADGHVQLYYTRAVRVGTQRNILELYFTRVVDANTVFDRLSEDAALGGMEGVDFGYAADLCENWPNGYLENVSHEYMLGWTYG
ncbi:hypothetical protein F4779DRAFT_639244 [Xylariaceae sp. FL0662B]|nr:hypothetical protein F4779DRAFT_639244 [Xylariaceae sp. FL0662B]